MTIAGLGNTDVQNVVVINIYNGDDVVKVKVRLKIEYNYYFKEPEWLVAQYKIGINPLYKSMIIMSRSEDLDLDLFLCEINKFLNREDMEEELKQMVIKDIKRCAIYKHRKTTNKEKEKEILDRLKNIKFEFEINDKDLK